MTSVRSWLTIMIAATPVLFSAIGAPSEDLVDPLQHVRRQALDHSEGAKILVNF